MALPDSLKRVGRYIELMDGAELPPDIAAETYTPTQVKRPPLRGNKPDEREDDTLRRSDPKALDAVLNGTCPQKLNLDIGSSADGSVTGIEGVAVSIYHGTARTLRAEEIRHGKDPSLYEIGREVLGLEDKQARALFQGPNNAGSARRWIGTQAAADACRALADGTAHEKLWEGKFDRLAIATAAAREAGADSTSYWETISWEVRGIAPGATVQPTASIADDVRIDNGAYIGENVRLESRVHVAQGATIEAGTVVRSASRIGERSHIHANCTIDGHVGGRGSNRSRRARRPGTGSRTRRQATRNADRRMRRGSHRKGRDHRQARNSSTTRVEGNRSQRRLAAGARDGDIDTGAAGRNSACQMGKPGTRIAAAGGVAGSRHPPKRAGAAGSTDRARSEDR